MTNAKINFDRNINSIHILDSIYCYLENQVSAVDITELLRAELVMIISALDCYIHEVVRDGIMDKFSNSINGDGLQNISIPLDIVITLIKLDDAEEKKLLLNEVVKKITSKDSYQSPKGIEYALAMLDIKQIWTKISTNMTQEPRMIKDQLSLYVHRRNKIAHESDINYATGEKIFIDRQSVIDCLNFICKLVLSIDEIIINNETGAA